MFVLPIFVRHLDRYSSSFPPNGALGTDTGTYTPIYSGLGHEWSSHLNPSRMYSKRFDQERMLPTSAATAGRWRSSGLSPLF